MNRRLLLAGVAVAAFSATLRPAHALFGMGDIVFDPTSHASQLVQIAKQAAQYEKQAQSYLAQLEQLKMEIQSQIAIPMQVYSEVTGTLQQLQSLTNASSLLAGNSGSIISRLNSAGAYADELSGGLNSITNIGSRFTEWQNTLGNSSRQLGLAIDASQSDLRTNAAAMMRAQSDSQSAAGTVQAIQAGTEVAAANGQILQQMAQTNIALAQQISTGQEIDADRRATEDAAMLHFATPQSVSTTGWQGF